MRSGGETVVFEGVNFGIEKGEFVCIIATQAAVRRPF